MIKRKRAIKVVGFLLGLVALLITLLITFGSSLGFVPAWNELFRMVGLAPADTEDYIAVVDVGNADCTVIYSDGHCVLIDTGGVGDNGHTVLEFLRSRDIRCVDYIVLTHNHSDHAGGLVAIAESMPVGMVILPDVVESADVDDDIMMVRSDVESLGVPTKTLTEGVAFSIGKFDFSVLFIDPTANDENDRSAVIRATRDDFILLFMGDNTQKIETKLMAKYPDLDCDFLKVGHHGSGTSTGEEFVQAVTPGYAAISCGDKWASIPSGDVVDRLVAHGAVVHRTDVNSHIFYYFKEDGVTVETAR